MEIIPFSLPLINDLIQQQMEVDLIRLLNIMDTFWRNESFETITASYCGDQIL